MTTLGVPSRTEPEVLSSVGLGSDPRVHPPRVEGPGRVPGHSTPVSRCPVLGPGGCGRRSGRCGRHWTRPPAEETRSQQGQVFTHAKSHHYSLVSTLLPSSLRDFSAPEPRCRTGTVRSGRVQTVKDLPPRPSWKCLGSTSETFRTQTLPQPSTDSCVSCSHCLRSDLGPCPAWSGVESLRREGRWGTGHRDVPSL